jgi:hypothetical protein
VQKNGAGIYPAAANPRRKSFLDKLQKTAPKRSKSPKIFLQVF